MLNQNLLSAKAVKNDEFYTRYEDVAKEVQNYELQLKDKVIYCNCDNPQMSQFWAFFHKNYLRLGLRGLIATYYDINGAELWKYSGGADEDIKSADIQFLLQGGSFDSQELISTLEYSDIVITNPPFSLFREFTSYLLKMGKDFLIIGSENAITYKDFFEYLKKGTVSVGINNVTKFTQPDGTVKSFGNICWYTTLCVDRGDSLKLTAQYAGHEAEYQKYINYNAINVDKLSEIPLDYLGEIGVPITFIKKFDKRMFEIVGADYDFAEAVTLPDGKRGTGRFYLKLADGSLKRLYSRILIKRRC